MTCAHCVKEAVLLSVQIWQRTVFITLHNHAYSPPAEQPGTWQRPWTKHESQGLTSETCARQICRHEMGPESERSSCTDACPPYFMEQAQQGYSGKYPDSVYPTLTLILPPYPHCEITSGRRARTGLSFYPNICFLSIPPFVLIHRHVLTHLWLALLDFAPALRTTVKYTFAYPAQSRIMPYILAPLRLRHNKTDAMTCIKTAFVKSREQNP